MVMKQLAAALYTRTKLDAERIDALQARLNVMRTVALVGWVGFVLVLLGV